MRDWTANPAPLRGRLPAMSIDVIDLRDFYSQRLGIVARRLINRGIHARWPDADGQRVLGIGYPTPYLGLFRDSSERCIAFMPAAQGVLKWPTSRPTLAALVDEFSLPLPDSAVDRILLEQVCVFLYRMWPRIWPKKGMDT